MKKWCNCFPSLFPTYSAGWISSALAKGIWNLTENICTLLWSYNYQQWNWWNNQASGGSHRACLYSITMGSCLLGILVLSSEEFYHQKTFIITGNRLIHGTTSLLLTLCQQVLAPRDYLDVVWPKIIIIVMSL